MERPDNNDSLSDLLARLQMALHIVEHGDETEASAARERARVHLHDIEEGLTAKHAGSRRKGDAY